MVRRRTLPRVLMMVFMVVGLLIGSTVVNWAAGGGTVFVSTAHATVRCNLPGIVDNNTNKVMRIQYDDTSGTIQTKDLQPGQSSTVFICDTDRFTMKGTSGTFWIGSITYPNAYTWNAGAFWPGSNGSIQNQHWQCSNRQGAGTLNVSCVTVY